MMKSNVRAILSHMHREKSRAACKYVISFFILLKHQQLHVPVRVWKVAVVAEMRPSWLCAFTGNAWVKSIKF